MNGIDTSGLTDYFKTVNRLVGQITDPGTIQERRLTTKNRSLSRENSRLENQNQQLENRNERLSSRNRSLQQNVSQLENQVGRLDQQLSQAQRAQSTQSSQESQQTRSAEGPQAAETVKKATPVATPRETQNISAPAPTSARPTMMPPQAAVSAQQSAEPGMVINTFA